VISTDDEFEVSYNIALVVGVSVTILLFLVLSEALGFFALAVFFLSNRDVLIAYYPGDL